MTAARHTTRGPLRLAVAALVAVLAMGACGSPGPTGSPSSAPASDAPVSYSLIEQQVVALRGLQPKSAVARKVVDQAGMRALVTASFRDENPESLVQSTQSLYRALLLLPATASLDTLWTDLLSSQVIGLYDDKTQTMYVLSSTGAVGPAERITYAHEYTHALQDQAFGLSSILGKAQDQGDRTLARLMLIEGDATLSMTLWAQAQLTPSQIAAAVQAADPASQAVLDNTPPIIKEPLLAEYTSGLTMDLQAYLSGGYAAVDRLFASPPDSTEQVLHADKLASHEPPIAVTLPADLATRLGAGWSVAMQDTLGELELGILLRDGGGMADTDATAAAAGWGGDRVALVEGPAGAEGVVLDTEWDTVNDAEAFALALQGLKAKLEAAGRRAVLERPTDNRVVLLTGDSFATGSNLERAMGFVGVSG
jgi:hypothetical protein